MYGIFTYIWLIFMGNVGTYTIHGSSGIELPILGRSKNCKYMVMFEGFPLNSALFGSAI